MAPELFIPSLLFLFGSSSIIALTKALETLGRMHIKKEFKKKPHFYFFVSSIARLFPKEHWNSLFSLLSSTQHLTQLLYTTTFFVSIHTFLFASVAPSLASALLTIGCVIAPHLFFEWLAQWSVSLAPKAFLRITTPVATLFLLLFSPLTIPLLKIQWLLLQRKKERPPHATRTHVKEKILEIVHESELSSLLDPLDRRLLHSIASFRDRIVREIMAPRIAVFSLSLNQTVHEAAQKFISEGYSRIPVYKESVDNMIGVLLYKDVMEYYFYSIENKEQSPLDTPS